MIKEYPIFDWSLGIPIIYKYDETQNEDDEIALTHEDNNND